MKVLQSLFCSLVIVTVIAAGTFAAETPSDPPATEIYQQEGEKGYYNYEVIPEEPEEEEDLPKVSATVQAPPQFSYDELWNMHPDQFQAHVNAVTKWAVKTPSEENVIQYLMVQDVARRKSAAFASVVSMVGQKNPQFSIDNVYPSTTPGRMAVKENQLDEIDAEIRKAKEGFALVMFSQEGCSFCTAQKSILGFFERNYEWPIRYVDIYRNPKMAMEFGVEQTPEIILVQAASGQAMPIASGVIAMSDLRSRVYRSVRLMNGEIKPEQWSTYRYERNTGNDPLKFVNKK